MFQSNTEALPGVEKDLYQKLVAATSERTVGGAVGNSISVQVLERILPGILRLAGLSQDDTAADVWQQAGTCGWREHVQPESMRVVKGCR